MLLSPDGGTADRDLLSDPLSWMLQLALVLFLVLMNGFFVAAEFAMVKLRGSRIDSLVHEGHAKAKFAAYLTGNLDAYLSACQLGITMASLGLGWIGVAAAADVIGPFLIWLGARSEVLIYSVSFIIAFAMITILHIVLGELAPKSVAIRKAEAITLLTAAPLVWFHRMMYPFIWMLNGLANGLVGLMGLLPASGRDTAHTEEEIRLLMQESHKSGHIDTTEYTLVDNIFEFAETNSREIMIPRTEMICLYANLPMEENKRVALEHMRTRYPVCEYDKDNIIGFIHIKDLLKDTNQNLQDIRQITRPVTSVPESMQISMLLKLMQKKKTQLAILIDEYGGTSGLVTLEDIMEEIVGEIQDEFDEERPVTERLEDGSYSISGLMLIEEVNSFFGLDISSGDYDTIGGWLYSQIEIPPKANHAVRYNDDVTFTVEETDHLRISRIVLRRNHAAFGGETAVSGDG